MSYFNYDLELDIQEKYIEKTGITKKNMDEDHQVIFNVIYS